MNDRREQTILDPSWEESDGSACHVTFCWKGRRRLAVLTPHERGVKVWLRGRQYDVSTRGTPSRSDSTTSPSSCPLHEVGSVPYACRLVAVQADVGQVVEAGQPLFRVESMKMEQDVTAPCRCTVETILAQAGATLARGDRIMTVREVPSS